MIYYWYGEQGEQGNFLLFTISYYRLEIFLFYLFPLFPFKIQVDKEGKIKNNRIKRVVIGEQGGVVPRSDGVVPLVPLVHFFDFS